MIHPGGQPAPALLLYGRTYVLCFPAFELTLRKCAFELTDTALLPYCRTYENVQRTLPLAGLNLSNLRHPPSRGTHSLTCILTFEPPLLLENHNTNVLFQNHITQTPRTHHCQAVTHLCQADVPLTNFH